MRKENSALIEQDTSKDDTPISTKRMIKEIYTFMEKDAYLILDGGEVEAYSLEQIDFYQPRPPLSTLISVGMGHLGTTIPTASGPS